MGNKNSIAAKDNHAEETPFQVIDKRHFLDLEHLEPPTAEEVKPRYPSFVEELLARVQATEKRFEERKAQMQEEIGRVRTRLENDFQRKLEQERQKILLPLIEVLDNLERALAARGSSAEALSEGIEMIAGLFRSKLQAQGVEAISALSQPFDPNLEQAVGVVPVTDPAQDGVVVEEVQRGYRMGDQLARPAMVRVGRYQG